jgi:hypothetical protein
MRWMILGALALVGAAPPRPVFEYKGWRAGESATPEQLVACSLGSAVIARDEEEANYQPSPPADKGSRLSPSETLRRSGEEMIAEIRAKAARERLTALSPEQRSVQMDMADCGSDQSTLAGKKVIGEKITLYRTKPSSLMVLFYAAGFSDVVEAFKVKYGTPCVTNIKQFQNRMGATFPSPHYEWCFARGRLVADMYYPDIETSTATWEDPQNRPPVGKPKVDF